MNYDLNKSLSLIELFNIEKDFRIEIPKIQRDYAQGRENESEVSDRFLDKIFEYLKDGKNLELDFIYGSVDKNVVYLLDGQQRVTTLFLLHWYIALREDRFNEIECLKKFTYSTRVSSREFCKNIINNIEKIKKSYDDKIELSNIITNFYWFTNENDPTIKAMLNMIDKKYKLYNENLFDRLKNIQFYFLPLEDFKLTDEIYLKMNARGKPLTSFENFKADLTDYILKINVNEVNNLIQQQLSDLDNKYTNFFWQLSKKYNEKNKQNNILLDDLYIKFFYRITLIYFIINYKGNNDKLINDKYYQYLKVNSNTKLEEKNKYSSFNVFEETYSKNLIENIFSTLNLLDSEYLLKIQSNTVPSWNDKYDDIMSMIEYELKDIIIFSALIFYIDKNNFKYNETSFKQWMRIVWNIIENSYIDESSSISLIKLFNELSKYSSDIYNFLADENMQIQSEISKEAVQYERRKCKFIIGNNDWEITFKEAEKHLFFRGYIDFLIDDNMDINKFNHRVKIFCSMFNNDGKYTFDEEHLFLRALIANIDNIQYFKKLIISDNVKNIIALMKSEFKYKHAIIREWFDSADLKSYLKNKEIEKVYDKFDNNEAKNERIKLAQEALKDSTLQDWISSKNEEMKVSWRYNCLYLNQLLIGSYRNKLISYLMKTYKELIENYSYIERCEIKENNNFYFGLDIIIKIKKGEEEYILNFDRWNKLTIKKGDEVILENDLNKCIFEDYKKILQTEFFDKY